MINKGVILLLGLFIPGLALALQPMSGDYVCSRLNIEPHRYNCYSVVRSSYIDSWAAGACDRVPSQQLTVDCIRTIANKTYLQSDVLYCDSLIRVGETIDCLHRYGRPLNGYPPPYPQPNPGPYPQPNPPPYPGPYPQPTPAPYPQPSPVMTIEKAKYIVDLLYQGILFRGPDAGGQQTYTSLILRKGVEGIRESAQALANSPEWHQNVRPRYNSEQILSQMYQLFFGRGVDSSGYGTYIPLINGGQQAKVAGALVTSDEFRRRNLF